MEPEFEQFWALSQDLLVVADYEGKLVRVSPSWYALTGRTAHDLLDADYTALTHPDDVGPSMVAVAAM